MFPTVLQQIVSLIRGRDRHKSVIWWTLYHLRAWEIIAVSATAILGHKMKHDVRLFLPLSVREG